MNLLRWIVLALCVACPGLAWHAGAGALWPVTAALYLAAAAMAAWVLHDDGILRAVLVPRAGDLALGVGAATIMYLGAWLVLVRWAAPAPALRLCAADGALVPRTGMHGLGALAEWLRDEGCAAFARSSSLRGPLRGVAVVAIAAAEELAWRGGVQQTLAEKLQGSTRGWLAASALYGLSALVTGNGAVALLAAGAGLVWGALYRYRERLAPAIFSHCVFSWFFFYNMPLLGLGR